MNYRASLPDSRAAGVIVFVILPVLVSGVSVIYVNSIIRLSLLSFLLFPFTKRSLQVRRFIVTRRYSVSFQSNDDQNITSASNFLLSNGGGRRERERERELHIFEGCKNDWQSFSLTLRRYYLITALVIVRVTIQPINNTAAFHSISNVPR